MDAAHGAKRTREDEPCCVAAEKRPRSSDRVVFVCFGEDSTQHEAYLLQDDDPAHVDAIAKKVEELMRHDIANQTKLAYHAINIYSGEAIRDEDEDDLVKGLSKAGTWINLRLPSAKLVALKASRVVFLYSFC